MIYHIARGEEQLGTFNDLDVSAGLRNARFLPTDLCWAEGMKEWQALEVHMKTVAAETGVAEPVSFTALREEVLQDQMQKPELASLWQRLAAYVIDFFTIMTPIMVILMAVMDAKFEAEIKAHQDDPAAVMTAVQRQIQQMQSEGNAMVLAMSWLFIALLITNIVLLTRRGQSIGKLALGIQIVRFPDGSKAGFIKTVLLRGLLFGIIGNVPVIGPALMIGNILMIFRQDRRCLHDWVADTQVHRRL